jgi:hypothetical protein
MTLLRGILACSRYGVLVALVSLCVFSGVAVAATRGESAGTTFRVTLKATLTKDWNYVLEGEKNGCPSRTHVQGRRVVTLRSTRPTFVAVTFVGRRARYSPAVVRFIGGTAAQTGAVRTEEGQPPSCVLRSVRQDCLRPRRLLAGQAVRFFRSRKNEISFARTRDFAATFPTACPPQTAPVRAERPDLNMAEGEILESAFRDTRIRSQTASARAVETTDFEGDGDGDGKVVVRVSWELTFARVR